MVPQAIIMVAYFNAQIQIKASLDLVPAEGQAATLLSSSDLISKYDWYPSFPCVSA